MTQNLPILSNFGDEEKLYKSINHYLVFIYQLHQSMPAVSSTADCEHVVDRNLVAGVRCSETHRLKSLARGAGGAQTQIFQTLDLISIYNPAVGERKGGKERMKKKAFRPSPAPSIPYLPIYLRSNRRTWEDENHYNLSMIISSVGNLMITMLPKMHSSISAPPSK